MVVNYLGWIGLGLGLLSRVFVPWLNERRNNPDKAQWSWRYVWPQLIAFGVAVLVLPLVVTDLESIAGMSFGPAWLIGWAAADVGRFIDKLTFARQ
jgi:hypothetical protein